MREKAELAVADINSICSRWILFNTMMLAFVFLSEVLYFICFTLAKDCSEVKLAYSLNFEDAQRPKDQDLLEVPDHFVQLINHPCVQDVALYIRRIVFLTRDGFQSSLSPLFFPIALKSGNNKLTAAVFVEEHVVMLIGNSVFSYHPKQKSWILAEGIKLDVDGISSYQCCISQEPFCKAVSSVVIAYRANIVMPEITIFLSNDGGYHFKEMRPIMQAEGIFQGAIIQPSVSTLSLLIKVDKKFHFRHFSVYGNLTSSDFVLNFDDSEATIIQPPGLKGHVVIWSQHSLLFSPNHGQNVYPIMVDGTTGRLNPLLNKHQNIHQVVINYESEIAILTSDGEIYFGILNMDALIVKIKQINFPLFGLIMFDKNGDLVVVEPKNGYFDGIFDFLLCVISINQAISNMPEALEECMIEILESDFQNKVHYIDMKESLNFSVNFVPKPGTSARCLIMVTNPDLLNFETQVSVFGKTIDDNWKFKLDVYLSLHPISETADYYLQERMFSSELSTLTVDSLHKNIRCRGMLPITTFVNVGCPLTKQMKVSKRVTACSKGILDPSVLQNNFMYVIKKDFYDPAKLFRPNSAKQDLIVKYDYASLGCPLVAHYAGLWKPELQLWYNNNYIEDIKVKYVMFEVNGIHDYNYKLHLSDVNCKSEAQNWTNMLKKQAHPDPHTAWNYKNFQRCQNPGPPSTASKSTEYQIMGGCFPNYIHFAKRNGFYVFKAIVVQPTFSFCELSTTFSIYVYGAYPEITYSSELLLGVFILIFICSALETINLSILETKLVAMSSSDSPPSWLGSPASCSSPVQVVRGGIFHSHFLKRISSEDASELQCNSDQHNSCDLCETNDCLECNEWIPPNSDTIQKIITQVEFYLSDENLAVDSFLLKHMKRNKTGYISIKLLTSFKKVKCLTKDWKATAYALNYSKLLEINPEGTKIRRKIPVPDFLLSVPPSKRILAWNLNKYFPEKNNEMWGRINIMETAMKIFAIYGPISSICILQPGKEIPAELKKYRLKYPEVGTKVCVLIEYECYEGAKNAYDELGKKHCHDGENLKVVILTGKGTKKISCIDTDESEDLKKSTPKKPLRGPTKMEQMQYTLEESVYSSSESDGANSPASIQRYLQHKTCGVCNCVSQMSNPSSVPCSQSCIDHHCGPCTHCKSLVYHHPSPKTDFFGPGSWPSPGTSPEFNKTFLDHWSDNVKCSGSPWVQRRKLAASQAAPVEINQMCKQSVRKHQSGSSLPPGLVRLPFGPDGTKGFHNSIGRGKIVLRH